MKKKALIAVLLLVLLVGGMSIITSVERSKSRKALTAYKAQLRSQGEKLTFEEAGYPFPLETNANLENFAVLADRLGTKSSIPANLDHMQLSVPGRAVVPWMASNPPCTRGQNANAQQPTWDELAADCDSAAATLAELRAELEHPPRYFGWNYTNLFSSTPKNPFVQKRKAAQFLVADSLAALHEHQLPRAQADLHAMTQLAQVHRSDVTLVSAMIRVAISGLGLAATWEALPAEGWDEPGLLALQRDWEAIDLAEVLETGFVGERLFGQHAFALIRKSDLDDQSKKMSSGWGSRSKPGLVGLRDELMSKGAVLYWRGHIDEDELFYLHDSQARVEAIRKLKSNTSGAALQLEMKAQLTELQRVMDSPMWKYRHLFSAIAIPNFSRAFQSAVRSETQRRMTVTAIALKRSHLRNAHYPAALSELVPQFIAAELMDPWSGKPFHYRLNEDGTFTLYSVGEDGRDDGGDPTPDKSTNVPPDMWTGKDAVWPEPVFPAAQ